MNGMGHQLSHTRRLHMHMYKASNTDDDIHTRTHLLLPLLGREEEVVHGVERRQLFLSCVRTCRRCVLGLRQEDVRVGHGVGRQASSDALDTHTYKCRQIMSRASASRSSAGVSCSTASTDVDDEGSVDRMSPPLWQPLASACCGLLTAAATVGSGVEEAASSVGVGMLTTGCACFGGGVVMEGME